MTERRVDYRQTTNDDLNDSATLRDPEAFAAMMRRYYDRVFLTALSMARNHDMAEDIAQETFLRAWLKRDTVKDSKLLLQPWLVRIARNLTANWLRSGQQRSRVLPLVSMEELMVEPADNERANPRQSADQLEQNAQLAEAMLQMPDDLRQVVLLHYAEGMSASDIARMNGEAPSTVTRRLEKARGQIRAHLESGLAAGLAMMKPGARSLEKSLGILAAAAALPSVSRAQILQMVSDTPPPPLIDAVTSAANAVPNMEAGTMKSVMGTMGVGKVLAGIAAAAIVIGGGVYAVKSIDGNSRSGGVSERNGSMQAVKIGTLDDGAGGHKVSLKSRSQNGNSKNSSGSGSLNDATTESESTTRKRLSPAERVALLENDSISTQPQLVVKDGETTERLYFNVEVVDESGLPVKGAKINIYAIMALVKMDLGSRGFTSDPADFVTNEKGIARAYVPRYWDEKLETGGVYSTISHPDYATGRYRLNFSDFKKVVLKRGDSLTVYAYDENSSNPITSGITLTFGPQAMYLIADRVPKWENGVNGALILRHINAEKIGFYLKKDGKDGRLLVSDFQTVEFPRKTKDAIHVTLHPTFSVQGSLSSNVSRPVIKGEVVALHTSDGPNSGQYQYQSMPINEDGTFELKDMPPGEIQIWAIANGWCSVNGDVNRRRGTPQSFILQSDGQAYELPMEQTATAIVKLIDPNGNPVGGASLATSPNMCYENSCGYWIRKRFTATSNAEGIAVIPDIPPLKRSRFGVYEGWELSAKQESSDDMDRTINFDLLPGQTLEKTLIVYPEGTTVITQDGDKVTTAPGKN